MKKIVSLLLCLMLMAGILTGCANDTSPTEEDGLSIVTTIFPVYDWVRELSGANAHDAAITMLLDSGVDLHSYQPTAEDIIKISNADLFIYVGGESEEWVEDVLKSSANANRTVINLLDVLGDAVKTEEMVAGMQESAEPQPSQEEESTDEVPADESGAEADEHVWLSLKNAEVLCTSIADQLAEIDPQNRDSYAANLSAYLQKLSALDSAYQQVAEQAAHKTVLFGDRFPFRYLVDDYGLDYYAAFSGCSAESEASFETITFLAQTVDALNLPCVLTIEGTNHKIAETIVANTTEKNQQVLTMDSMQSTTAADIRAGATYLSVMEQNLSVLTQALN